jgi:hypothetical protein
MKDGGHVVWIGLRFSVRYMESRLTFMVDTSSPIPRPRFDATVGSSGDDISKQFHHYQTSTLAHLLALVHHPKPNFPPRQTALLVIDAVSTLFPLPLRKPGPKLQSCAPKFATALLHSTLLTALTRLASVNNFAVLLISQVSTRMRNGASALLVAAQGSKDWDDGISSQIAMFRDFPPPLSSSSKSREADDGGLWDRLRYVEIIKVHGVMSLENSMFKDVIPFALTKVRVRHIALRVQLIRN